MNGVMGLMEGDENGSEKRASEKEINDVKGQRLSIIKKVKLRTIRMWDRLVLILFIITYTQLYTNYLNLHNFRCIYLYNYIKTYIK